MLKRFLVVILCVPYIIGFALVIVSLPVCYIIYGKPQIFAEWYSNLPLKFDL